MKISASAPGRICLFGEHQDYLKLPVISMAINRRVSITGSLNNSDKVFIDLPNIQSNDQFTLPTEFLEYSKKRDYFKSSFNVLKKKKINPQNGFDCIVDGNIPINSGTSSSSALNNAWIAFMLKVSENFDKIPLEELGYLSYLAEVEEFDEAGGMMDQMACAVGGTQFIEFESKPKLTALKPIPGYFVLGDSQQPKDTQKILSETKLPAFSGLRKINEYNPNLNFSNLQMIDIDNQKNNISEIEVEVLKAAVLNRNLTQRALIELQTENPDYSKIGKMLTELHEILANSLKISTSKIDRMLQSAIKAGAIGGKINGSGGGGCMFVYAPNDPEKVKLAIESEGGKAWIIQSDVGVI
jgi:galactokinase